jgi:DNA-binding CsgD family transcriptional regulator
VRRLSERDASAMLAFVSELRDLDEPVPFPPRLVARLHTLISSDAIGYSELDPARRSSVLQVWSDADGETGVIDGDAGPAEVREEWWRVRGTHPVCGYRGSSGDWTTVYKVSDFATLREFRRTAIYDAFYRGAIDHWLDFGLAATPTKTRVFIFLRHKRSDFDERDRLVAELLQPHLAARAEAVKAASQGASALAAIEEGLGEYAGSLVLCSATGVIEFASPRARSLLERYVGIENGRIAPALLRRRDFVVESGHRRLNVLIAQIESLRVLMLNEFDLRIRALTGRERQVLELAALGRGNQAIALELGIAVATVAKHLERVYRKLGVPNRSAAVALLDGRSVRCV